MLRRSTVVFRITLGIQSIEKVWFADFLSVWRLLWHVPIRWLGFDACHFDVCMLRFQSLSQVLQATFSMIRSYGTLRTSTIRSILLDEKTRS